jgi:hypothetical protein
VQNSTIGSQPLALGLVDDTLNTMKGFHVTVWSILLAVGGGGLLAYLVTTRPPRQVDGQLDLPIVLLFFGGLLLLITGCGAGVARSLHLRWPGLAMGNRITPAKPALALRQGFLLAWVVIGLLLLQFFQLFDVVFVVALPLLAGLLEVYLQQRSLH